eukprot:7077612-Prymnesium_polylepis.1
MAYNLERMLFFASGRDAPLIRSLMAQAHHTRPRRTTPHPRRTVSPNRSPPAPTLSLSPSPEPNSANPHHPRSG